MAYIQKEDKDFNDLVVERIRYLAPEDATTILTDMFPELAVSVYIDRGGNTVISVGDVEIRVAK